MSEEKIKAAQWSLLAANFVVGFSVLIVPGMLTALAEAFSVTVPRAGQLITAASIVLGLGAPILAALTSTIDRRHLLVASAMVFVVGHLLCAFAPDFFTLMLLRAVTLISAAIITPQAAATIGLLVPPASRPAAIAMVFTGWSLAFVVTMPLANLMARHLGWQNVFIAASLLSLGVAFWLMRAIPKGLTVAPLSLSSWLEVFRHPVLLPVLLVTLVAWASQFQFFSFQVPLLEVGLGLSALMVIVLLTAFGLAAFVGNSAAIRILPKLGPGRLANYSLVIIALSQCLYGVAMWLHGEPQQGFQASVALILLVTMTWGLCSFASSSAQQGRLMMAEPQLASASIALNTSFLYAGQALGTPLGAWIIASHGYRWIPWSAAAVMLVAIGISWYAKSERL